MAALKKYAKSKGRKRSKLHRRASSLRKRLVAANHSDVAQPFTKEELRELPKRMSKKYRHMLGEALSTKSGRAALKRYRKFTGLPWPTEIVVMETPGRGRRTLTGMGSTPVAVLADRRGGKKRKRRFNGLVACDSTGRRIEILRGRNSKAKKPRLRQVGFAAETHYVPTRLEERAGTFKRGRYWVHEHNDEGGRWPKVYEDQAGNLIYGKGTYKVTDWIRR